MSIIIHDCYMIGARIVAKKPHISVPEFKARLLERSPDKTRYGDFEPVMVFHGASPIPVDRFLDILKEDVKRVIPSHRRHSVDCR